MKYATSDTATVSTPSRINILKRRQVKKLRRLPDAPFPSLPPTYAVHLADGIC